MELYGKKKSVYQRIGANTSLPDDFSRLFRLPMHKYACGGDGGDIYAPAAAERPRALKRVKQWSMKKQVRSIGVAALTVFRFIILFRACSQNRKNCDSRWSSVKYHTYLGIFGVTVCRRSERRTVCVLLFFFLERGEKRNV